MIKDMTKGNISKHLISFSIPLILGNVLQLTYNAVDSIIVGRFSGTDALAAVGNEYRYFRNIRYLYWCISTHE